MKSEKCCEDKVYGSIRAFAVVKMISSGRSKIP